MGKKIYSLVGKLIKDGYEYILSETYSLNIYAGLNELCIMR